MRDIDIYPYYMEESLGNKLKAAREAKGLSFDFISQETKITKRYLEALELENFDTFPGESYVMGFIKSYGAYLELDVDELLSIYRLIKLQGQPLVVQKPPKTSSHGKLALIVIVTLLIVLSLAGTALWFFG